MNTILKPDTEPVAIRASSLFALLDCPARWLAIHRDGRRSPTTYKAVLGRAVHAGTALFDSERLAGQTPSVEAAAACAVETFENPGEDVATEEDDDKVDQQKDIAANLTKRYCTGYAPTVEYAAVEIGVDSLHLTDLDIVLSGTADRVRVAEDGLGIADLKTGKSAVNAQGQVATKGHAVQLGVYTLLAEAALGQRLTADAQIIGLQTNVTPEKQRIAAATVTGVRDVLIGDDEQPGILPVAARLAHGEMTFGNPRSMLCSDKFCPIYNQCFFRR